jgi:hypothetical protein
VPEFIKDHISAALMVLGTVVGVFGIIGLRAAPPIEWFIAGVVLCGIGGGCFFAASRISPRTFRGNEKPKPTETRSDI